MFSDPSLLIWGLGLLVLLVVLGALFGAGNGKPKFSKKRFLSESEARVLTLLEAALPQHRVMAQVAMGALLNAAEADKKRARATRNQFAQKIVDFAVVTRDTAEVIALVELDDRTHRASKDAARDTMAAAAGYQTIRIPSKPRPTAEIVSAAVATITAPPLAVAGA